MASNLSNQHRGHLRQASQIIDDVITGPLTPMQHGALSHARTLIGNITDPPVAPAPAVTQAAPPAAAVGSVKPPTPKPKPTPAARSMAAVKAAKTKAGNKANTAATAKTSGTAGATATVVEPDNLTD